MLRSSIPLGRIFDVDLRVHLSFFALLALSVIFSIVTSNNASRGVGLWLALCFAVVVREFFRAIAGAHARLRLRALILLPIGGIMAFEPAKDGQKAQTSWITAAGPLGNLVIGLLMLGTCYAFVPGIHLFAQPWITTSHILRSFIWMQFILAVVGLLPSLGPSRLTAAASNTDRAGALGVFNLGAGLALATVILGIAFMNLWLVILGAFILLGSQMSRTPAQAMNSPESESILVRDVMLTEYTLLSASDTLGGALSSTRHSLQDVFPVVRGDQLVGSVARATLIQNLQTQGDGYLQGVMTRTVPIAAPEEKLVEALRRSAAVGGTEFIPVVEEGAMLGILTPQSLTRAVQIVNSTRLRQQRAESND